MHLTFFLPTFISLSLSKNGISSMAFSCDSVYLGFICFQHFDRHQHLYSSPPIVLNAFLRIVKKGFSTFGRAHFSWWQKNLLHQDHICEFPSSTSGCRQIKSNEYFRIKLTFLIEESNGFRQIAKNHFTDRVKMDNIHPIHANVRGSCGG